MGSLRSRALLPGHALLSGLALVLAACGAGAGPGGSAGSGSSGGALSQDLTFSGAVAGHITSATGVCVSAGPDYSANVFGQQGGKTFTFQVHIQHPAWHGAGTYPSRLTLAANLSENTAQVTTATEVFTSLNSTGSLTVDSALKAGTIDMGMTKGGAAGAAEAHAKGRWRCG
jgi:hypothetical protein